MDAARSPSRWTTLASFSSSAGRRVGLELDRLPRLLREHQMRLHVGHPVQNAQRGDGIRAAARSGNPHDESAHRSTDSTSVHKVRTDLWTVPRVARRRATELVCVLLVDERRLPVLHQDGFGDALAPAAFLARLVRRRVLGDGERRAIVRRIAATHEDAALAPHLRASPSFAGRVLDALDRDAVPAPFESLAQHVRSLVAFADALDVRSALRHAVAAEPVPERRDAVDRRGARRERRRRVRVAAARGRSRARAGSRGARRAGAAAARPARGRRRRRAAPLRRLAERRRRAPRAARAAERRAARRRAHAARDRRRPRELARRDREGRRRRREPVRARPRDDHRRVQGAGRVGVHAPRGDRERVSARTTRAAQRRARARGARLRRGARVRGPVGGARPDRGDRGGAVELRRRGRRRFRTSRPREPVADEPARAGRDAQALVQRVVAQHVRRVQAQVVVPLRVRGGRGPRLVRVVLRDRVPRRARRLSRHAHAVRRRRRRDARAGAGLLRRDRVRPPPHALRRAGRVRAAAAPRAPHREEVSVVAAGARAPRAVRGDRLRDASRRGAGRPPLHRLHRPPRPRRAQRHRDRRRLQDRLDRDQRRRVLGRGARVPRVPAAVLLLGAHRRRRRRVAARARSRSKTRCSTSRRSSWKSSRRRARRAAAVRPARSPSRSWSARASA